jgi:hypothetical protein
MAPHDIDDITDARDIREGVCGNADLTLIFKNLRELDQIQRVDIDINEQLIEGEGAVSGGHTGERGKDRAADQLPIAHAALIHMVSLIRRSTLSRGTLPQAQGALNSCHEARGAQLSA